SFIRVIRGEMASDGSIYNCSAEKVEKVTGYLHINGKETKRIDKAVAGDIVVISKMDSLTTCTTITGTAHCMFEEFPFPLPTASFAVHPKTQKDVDKVGEAIGRIRAEDPTFVDRIDPVTKERVIVGLTDLHLHIMLDRMKKRSKVEVETSLPVIPYKETITGKAADSYRHKKQSGGAGEFGEVHIEVSPSERGAGFEFENAIFGGSIDRVFIPSVEKGLKEQMTKGVIAGFPVVDVHARLYDGKTHPVDSKDRAFQVAARECLKKIFPLARPKLLEPYIEMEVHIPTEKVGDILADISGARRGRVNDQVTDGDFATIMAIAPLAEIQTYSQSLQSMTGGEGTFTMKFSNYEIVPENIAQQIIARYSKKVEEK
ncbi:MAG: elongation factor G, partial [Planctomycetes bacterium]|nr:elongation factor G [Planctomycetota bacterium]